jgi:hypothetical protein
MSWHFVIPLLALALVLLGADRLRKSAKGATDWPRTLRPVVLIALALAVALLVALRSVGSAEGSAAPSWMASTAPYWVAAALFLVGWHVLHDYGEALRRRVEPPPGAVRLLASLAEAAVVGATAGALTLMSAPLVGALGLAGQAGLYAACLLAGLFILVGLPGPVSGRAGQRVAIAASACLSVVQGLAAPAGEASAGVLSVLPLVVALSAGWLGGLLLRAGRGRP